MIESNTTPNHGQQENREWANARSAETYRFTLSPSLWSSLHIPIQLNWSRVKFEPASASKVPNDLIGVYTFVIEPNIANLDLGYLLYVGMTRQNFRARFRAYLRHQREERTKRPRVQEMLRTWSDHLSFNFAPIDEIEDVKSVEDELIIALKPPVLQLYPGRVRDRFKLLDIVLS